MTTKCNIRTSLRIPLLFGKTAGLVCETHQMFSGLPGYFHAIYNSECVIQFRPIALVPALHRTSAIWHYSIPSRDEFHSIWAERKQIIATAVF